MPVSGGDPLACPQCGTEIRLTLAAWLRAVDIGTAVSCPHCHGAWLLQCQPNPEFLPLATPKRKRGPRRYHPDEE